MEIRSLAIKILSENIPLYQRLYHGKKFNITNILIDFMRREKQNVMAVWVALLLLPCCTWMQRNRHTIYLVIYSELSCRTPDLFYN